MNEKDLVKKIKNILFNNKKDILKHFQLKDFNEQLNLINNISDFDNVLFNEPNTLTLYTKEVFSEIICSLFFHKLNDNEQIYFLNYCDLKRKTCWLNNFFFLILNDQQNTNDNISQKTLNFLLKNSDLNLDNMMGLDFFRFFHANRLGDKHDNFKNSFLYKLSQENFDFIIENYIPRRVRYEYFLDQIIYYKENNYLNVSLESIKKLIDIIQNKQNINFINKEEKQRYELFLVNYDKYIINKNIQNQNIKQNIGKNKI